MKRWVMVVIIFPLLFIRTIIEEVFFTIKKMVKKKEKDRKEK